MEAIFRQNNTLTTSKILKSQKKRNSSKTIKDVLLIILSKNNGIVRIIEAKFDGEKRRNLQHTAEFAKWAQVSKFIGTKYRQVCMLCYAEYDNYV